VPPLPPLPERPAPEAEPDWVVIGRVARPHGLRGEVAVDLTTDFPERYQPGLTVQLRDERGERGSARLRTVRPHAGRLLVTFEGVEDATAAEGLRGVDLCVGAGDAPPRPEGYLFHHEIAGCHVVDTEGRALGTVRDLVEVAGRPMLVLDTPAGERDVPFTRPIFVSADMETRRVVLDPPSGLLD